MNITVIATNENITIIYLGETLVINFQKNKSVFKSLLKRIKSNNVQWIIDNFNKIKSDIELKSSNNFSIHEGKVVLKNTIIPVPEIVLKKLEELEKDSKSIVPLLKFWKKLSENPSEDSRRDLYSFMQANNIPITEEGDIVTEKGVRQKSEGLPGELVDCRTETFDNSIGAHVTMKREDVDPDRNQTCSTGLHVGAPDYVRQHYSDDIIVECLVNPKDVVTVPTDYKNTKMRVCAYRVAGYSVKTTRSADKVIKLEDFISTIPKVENEQEKDLKSMSAKNIVAYVEEITGEKITISLKSKKSIIKKAKELLLVHSIIKNENKKL